MSSEQANFPSTSALVDKVPLIKSPSFWVPKPVELPPDIHPLPEDVHAYFVYPHTIESHALSVLPQSLKALQQNHESRLHLLASLAESRERARKARLNQLAPGWAEGSVMQPVRKEATPAAATKPTPEALTKDLMDGDLLGDSQGEATSTDRSQQDFVDGLFALDSSLGAKKQASEGDLI